MRNFIEGSASVIFSVCFVFVVLGGLVYGLWSLRLHQVGEGQHRGYISAVDERGYFYRNYDVFFKTEAESSQEDVYCIYRDNKDLIEKAKEVSQSRELVTIYYHGVRGWGRDLCEGSEITAID